MNKRKKSAIAIYAIVAVVFILLTLIIPFRKIAASWIMFAFSLLSIAAGAFITFYAFGKSEVLMSKFYGYPVFRIGFLYTAAQLIATIIIYVVCAFTEIPSWIGLLLSVLLAGLAAIGVITTDNARDYVEEIDIKTSTSIKNVTKFNNDIADTLDLCQSDAVRAPLQKLVTKFRYSDPVSSPATEQKEKEIEDELGKLKAMIASSNDEQCIAQIQTIDRLLSSRNRLCESGK